VLRSTRDERYEFFLGHNIYCNAVHFFFGGGGALSRAFLFLGYVATYASFMGHIFFENYGLSLGFTQT
jgi:hypothetical protein